MTETKMNLYNISLSKKVNNWKVDSLLSQHTISRKSDLSYNFETLFERMDLPELEENY